jgi:hypothetical protein
MTSEIKFQVKTIDGSVITFTANRSSTMIDVIGSSTLQNSCLLLNGQPINRHMSLHHEKITDGAVRYLLHERSRAPRKRIRRQLISEWLICQAFEEEDREERKEQERARISDLIWSGWEMLRKHDRIRVMTHERQTPKPAPSIEHALPNLAQATEISAEPGLTARTLNGHIDCYKKFPILQKT